MKNLVIFLTIGLQIAILFGCGTSRVCDCKSFHELGAIPVENGTSARAWQCKQIENGQAERGFVYLSDWIGATNSLSPCGKQQLDSWTRLEGSQPPLILEASEDPALDQSRLSAVSGYMASRGFVLSPDSLRISNSTERLNGVLIERVYEKFQNPDLGGGSGTQSGQPGLGTSSAQNGGIF